MKNLTLISLFFILFFSTIRSQATLEWAARYTGINPVGNDLGKVITVDDDGFVYVAGKTAGLSNFDYITIKYSAEGDTIWTKTFNGAGNGDDEILAIEVDFQGNVYVTGRSMGITTGFDIVTIKYDLNGNLIWRNTHLDNFNEDDIGKDLKIDAFSNVYVCGSVRTSNNKPVIFKISSNGSTLWTINTSVFNDLDSAEQLLIGADGNLLVSAVDYFSFNLSNTSYRILEVNQNNGNVIRGYNSGIVRGFPKKFKTDSNGNIYMLSSAWWGINYEVYWAKFVKGITDAADVSGFSSTALHEAIDFDLDANNNFYILCKRFFVKNSHFIFRENFDNTFYWEKDFNTNTSSDDIPISIHLSNKESNSPSVFVTGQNSLGKMTLSKYSNSGDSLWTNFYGCSSNNSSSVNSTQIDKCDNIYFTGYSSCNGTGQDIKTLKYSTVELPVITVEGSNPICEGTSIMLSTTTCIGCTYLWSTGETTSSISVSPIVATDYIVEVKYPSDCVLTSLPKKIMVNPLLTPGVSISAASPSICKGENVVFTANHVNGGVNPSFQWYLNSVLQNGNTSTFSISTLNDGDVVSSTMISNANCLATNMAVSNSVTLSVFELLPTGITISSSDNTICQGESVTFLATPSNGGASPVYQWFVDGVLQSNQSGSSFTTTLNQSATIYGTMTSNAVCPDPSIVLSESIFITVKPNLTPQISISASLNEICEGQNITFTASEIHGGSTPIYQWYINGVLQPNQNSTFSGSNFADGSEVTCKLTSNEDCTTAPTATSNIITITVHPILIPSVEISSPQVTICAGQNLTFTATSANAGNAPAYKWYINNELRPGSGSTYTATNLTNGDQVSCIMTSNANCISQSMAISNTIAIAVNPLPTAAITPGGPTSFCEGNSVSLLAIDAASYLWNDGQTTQSIIVSNSGNHSVIVSDNNGCSATSNTTSVIVHPLPSDTITKSGPTEFCLGNAVSLLAALAQTYVWNTGETSQSISVSANGDYVVTVTNENGCSAVSLPTTITVYPLPASEIVPNGPTTFCLGDNVILSASEALSYIWSSGQTSRSVVITSPGAYAVTVTDANGCSAVSSDMLVTVNELLTPTVAIMSSANAICAGENVTFNATATNSGTMPLYQWYVNGILQVENGPVFSTNILDNNQQVLCRMTSNAECVTQPLAQSNIISISVNPLMTPEVSISTTSTSVVACQEVTFTPTPTNGGVSPSYQWFLNGNPVSSSPTFSTSALINGDQISCIMTSSATCKSSPTATSNVIIVSVSPLSQPIISILGDTIFSSNYKDALYEYTWFYNGSAVSTSPFIICNQFGSGSYYLVINYNGCTVSSNAMDIVCTVPTKDIGNQRNLIVYPNPTNGMLNISGTIQPADEIRVSAYNQLGQKLEDKRISFSNDNVEFYLDMASYACGIYTIVVYGDTFREVFKVYKID